mmetsp:Transcript_120994/g.301917  ORF Transcript_120994/g.301917 Transcript_120994/m.301917 type:complete len:333 (+) Transcript_120994:127-1125(+)
MEEVLEHRLAKPKACKANCGICDEGVQKAVQDTDPGKTPQIHRRSLPWRMPAEGVKRLHVGAMHGLHVRHGVLGAEDTAALVIQHGRRPVPLKPPKLGKVLVQRLPAKDGQDCRVLNVTCRRRYQRGKRTHSLFKVQLPIDLPNSDVNQVGNKERHEHRKTMGPEERSEEQHRPLEAPQYQDELVELHVPRHDEEADQGNAQDNAHDHEVRRGGVKFTNVQAPIPRRRKGRGDEESVDEERGIHEVVVHDRELERTQDLRLCRWRDDVPLVVELRQICHGLVSLLQGVHKRLRRPRVARLRDHVSMFDVLLLKLVPLPVLLLIGRDLSAEAV